MPLCIFQLLSHFAWLLLSDYCVHPCSRLYGLLVNCELVFGDWRAAVSVQPCSHAAYQTSTIHCSKNYTEERLSHLWARASHWPWLWKLGEMSLKSVSQAYGSRGRLHIVHPLYFPTGHSGLNLSSVVVECSTSSVKGFEKRLTDRFSQAGKEGESACYAGYT